MNPGQSQTSQQAAPAQTPTPQQRLALQQAPLAKPVMRQRWSNLLFLHWPVDPEVIRPHLPAGLQVDLFDDQAWIGVVPFAMERVHPVGLPPLPWISWFLELNVRTYVHDGSGQPGVWFFSLDCNQPIAVEVARRFFHLPYHHARMSAKFPSGEIVYSSRRKGSENVSHFRYRRPVHAEPAREHSLEWFLVERYLLFTSDRSGKIRSGRVHHQPYRIEEAQCSEWSSAPIEEDGLGSMGGPPASMLVAEPVEVRIFPLE
jgi:uncharacterized protein YqjF (DUF2071 family)